ncbi:hypothetical protein PORY_001777 [Pneumocystis oryctolagi]|uniref:Uncharacterized protein n=1 Tax=Pneumocystis oryctolagi TaxID=42067 RepID=A0ACB7CCY3_9ASCO|nr:hypothetical protein PORY_001777 [Pneumocystis oryctolagi]
MASRECLYGYPELLEQLQGWVVAMSSSTFRSFRHTSTIVSLAIVSSLCDILGGLNKEEQVVTKQYEAEKKKKSVNDERVKMIKAKRSSLEQQIEFLNTVINDFFDSVFVHRYRDVDPRIRCDCVHALGLWMIKLPSVFFDGAYLRYMGWVLSDISPLTRLEVVKTLTKLYSNTEFIAGLRHFTERFKSRLVEMALHEADPNVRCSSISLLNEIRICGFLENNEIDLICTLLFDVDSKIRKRACLFFLSKVDESFENKVREIGDLSLLKYDKKIQNNTSESKKISWIKYKIIAELLVQLDETTDNNNNNPVDNLILKNHNIEYLDIVSEATFENRMHLVAMTICSEVDELKNWELLSEYLLYDHVVVSSQFNSSKEFEHKFYEICSPTEKEEITLLEILFACLSSYIKEEHEESISRSLLELVPSLLKKYNASTSASACILRLQQLMKLSVYQQFRQNKTYENLLDLIGKQFMKHPNNLVMREAAASLLKAQQYDEFASITQEKILEIQEELVGQLKSILLNKNLKTQLSNKTVENLAITIKRLDYISSISDCIQIFETESFSVFSILLEIIERDVVPDNNELEMIVSSLRTLKWLYIWRVKHLMDYKDSMFVKEFNIIIKDRNKLSDKLCLMVKSKKYYKIGYHVVFLLIDLYIVLLNLKKINTIQTVDESIFIIPEEIQDIIMSILNYYVRQYAKLSGSKGIKFLSIDEESDQEFEDSDNEKEGLVFEKRVCEIAGKVVVAVSNGAMSRKHISYLVENKGKLGLSYNHVIAEFDTLKKNEKFIEKD